MGFVEGGETGRFSGGVASFFRVGMIFDGQNRENAVPTEKAGRFQVEGRMRTCDVGVWPAKPIKQGKQGYYWDTS